MNSTLLALYRDETSQDSVEYALVIAMLGLGVMFLSRLPSNGRRIAYSAIVVVPQVALTSVVDAILAIGEKRKAILLQLRSALVAHKDVEALELARELCGLVARNEESY
jgi:hypothetical protein